MAVKGNCKTWSPSMLSSAVIDVHRASCFWSQVILVYRESQMGRIIEKRMLTEVKYRRRVNDKFLLTAPPPPTKKVCVLAWHMQIGYVC